MDASFLARMRAKLGDSGVLTGTEVSARSCDPFKPVPADVAAILRPRSTEEVSYILKEATASGYTSVVHGGLTGVSGGAYTGKADLVLSLELMKRIEEITPITRTVIAQAGVTIQQLQLAAQEAGLFYPVDLGSRGTATVGGTISTNAGGNRTLRWGMTRDRVLGLEAVLPDGQIISSMNKLLKNNTGYDLKQLFIGAEGTLGIVTRVVLRLVPLPTSHDVAFLAVDDYDSVIQVLNLAQTLSSLSAFELMYADFYGTVTKARPANRPVSSDHPYYVLIESMGYHADTDRTMFEEFLGKLDEQGLAKEIVLAESETQRNNLWAVREAVDVAVQALAPILTYDVSLEVTDIDVYVNEMRLELARQFPGAQTIIVGHIGDNNIHIGIAAGPDTKRHEASINDIVYKSLIKFQGSVSAEHGIGTTKNSYLNFSRGSEEIELMRRIKELVDPTSLLNPKVLFTERNAS